MVSPLVQALSYQNSVNPTPAAVAPTDVVGAYRLASDAAEKNYAAKIAQQNAFFGGLAGLGGAGIMAFGKPLGTKLFGSTPAAAANPAAASTSAATSPLAAATGAGDSGILTGGSALGVSPADFAAQPALADASGASLSGPLSSLMGPAAAAPTVAGDFGLAGLGGGGADAAGSVAADLGATGAADAAGTTLADAGATAGADALASVPEWLTALLALA